MWVCKRKSVNMWALPGRRGRGACGFAVEYGSPSNACRLGICAELSTVQAYACRICAAASSSNTRRRRRRCRRARVEYRWCTRQACGGAKPRHRVGTAAAAALRQSLCILGHTGPHGPGRGRRVAWGRQDPKPGSAAPLPSRARSRHPAPGGAALPAVGDQDRR